jgi:holin-like protein
VKAEGLLGAVLLLLALQLAGESLSRALALPVSGPVIGFGLLVVLLGLRLPRPAGLEALCDALLRHLSLLFVPVGVGVVAHLGAIGGQGLRLALVLALSTVLTLAVTALVFVGARRLLSRRDDGA